MFSIFASLFASADSPRSRGRLLAAEPLERRELLSAAGLVEVGSQPSGALDDKIVYAHGGHGITWNGSSWGYQRPLLLSMVEDLGNQDQLTIFAEHLWNAGATVVPLRPIGNQHNEVIVDNVDAEVTFTGAWSDSSSPIYFGEAGEVPYRFASTSPVETATAEYRPNIPEAGFYPVYSWTRSGSDRVDQLYRVHHSGGATEVTVNHRRVGNGPVYLGTYYFEEGTDGYVAISNRSDESGVVIADMIRFGNGIGDIAPGGSISGQPRENEAGLYWIQWHAQNAQGVSSAEYGTSTVSAPPRYAEYMNREADGSLTDRVFVSYHSNATTGNPSTATSRGVIALHNTANGGATPNQLTLAQNLASEINSDLVAQNSTFDSGNWQSRSSLTFQASFNYGEINNSSIQNEFDATIIETGFHDNTQDARMLRDPEVRHALAGATVQGLVDYFRQIGDFSTPDIDAPDRVAGLTGETGAPGEVTLTWPAAGGFGSIGGSPDGYMVYASTNGYGFDGGTYVPGGSTTAHTLTGLTAGETYYFKVAAVNGGGQGRASEVVAVKPSASPEKILIVNGYDRVDETLVPDEPFPGGGAADRVRPRLTNSFDYAVQVATAINDAGATPAIETASNEAVGSGAVALDDYDAVIWISGRESSADDTYNAAEQAAVANYLAGGGKLFASGAEIAWDLDNLNNGRAFYNDSLRADFVADDAGSYDAAGVAGSIFDGLSLQFDDGDEVYDVAFPDSINPASGSTAALSYGGGGGTAAVQYEDVATGEQVVTLGFPFEALVGEGDAVDVMSRVLDFFGFEVRSAPQASILLDNDNGAPEYADTGFWTTSNDPGVGGGTQRFAFVGAAETTATWSTDLPFLGDAEVFVQYDAGTNRALGARYTVTVGGESREVVVDQRFNDFTWVSLGQFPNASGPVTVTLDASASTGANFSLVIADVVRVDVRGEAAQTSGDFNRDGVVDAADYTVYRDTRGQIVTPLTGADADGSGIVDAADRAIWLATYGQTVAPAPAQTTLTPEPAQSVEVPEAAAFALTPRGRSAVRTAGNPALSDAPGAQAVDEALLLVFAADGPTPDAGDRLGSSADRIDSEAAESPTGDGLEASKAPVLWGLGA